MAWRRFFRPAGATLLALAGLAVLFIALFGWNWMRTPIERLALQKTGRALVMGGDLKLGLGWPLLHVRADRVRFANPPWAREKQMVDVDAVDIAIHIPELFGLNLVLPEVRLERPTVFLEQTGDGRKNWLLDLNQQDEAARVRIGTLTLDHGRLGYDNSAQKTSIRADLSTLDGQTTASGPANLVFTAQGQYKGLPLKAHGSGGPVLALRDESVPYPLKVGITVGGTSADADGTITSLLNVKAMDMRLALRGGSLALLYPLLGIAFPETHAYTTHGHLLRRGQTWLYEDFSGQVGASDMTGRLQVDSGGKRPVMTAALVSRLLDIDDLGPLIGVRTPGVQAARPGRVLPDMPFRTDSWSSVDADVSLSAKTIRRARELPLENLSIHLKLKDSLLTLDPLDFGLAGGHLKATISLDGRQNPIRARARMGVSKVFINKLFPTLDLAQTSIGQVNGDFEMAGTGNSIDRMLATSEGRVRLVVAKGEISKLLMEKMGLHLLEILQLKLTGDKTIQLRCAVADFVVKSGVLQANALVLDTDVSTVLGKGSIDLAQEKLDLTLEPKTRNTSPVALRSPIHVGGTFSQPEVGIDKGRIAARGLGALALGLVNPLLALIPLVEMGPGTASECMRLVPEARPVPGGPVPRVRP